MKYSWVIIIIFLFACEEQRRMIIPFIPSGERVILLEEFTGKGCTNCPKGSREIENLLTLFPDNLVAVSIHAGFFANPSFFPLGQYDLRSPQAQDLFDLLGPNSYPAGVVNRTPFNNMMQLGSNAWAAAIAEQIQLEPAVELSLIKEYNPVTRELIVAVSGIAKESVSGDIRLSVMLTESGIVDAQDDIEAGGIVQDYIHNHVLRDMMTPSTGAPFIDVLSTGQTFTQTYAITLNTAWIPDNMEIVAFVSNVQGSAFPILQATSAHVID